MKKIFCLLCIAALCYSNVLAAQAAIPAGAMWNPDDTTPTLIDVASAAARARATRCNTASCKAIIVINELIDIARYEDGDANGVASLYRGTRPQIAGRRLDHALLDHPALFGPVCATGAKLMRKVRLGPGIYEMIVPVQLLINGVDMDLRDHGHCARDLVAALPEAAANAEVRQNAHVLCIHGDENQHRPRAACDVLIQGLHTGR